MWLRWLFVLGLLCATAAQAADSLTPTPIQTFFDNNGAICVGCKLFTYQASTTTKLATYTNSGGGTANSNPVILDGAGRANIWLPPSSTYKFVLAPSTDTDPPTNPFWTVDLITNGAIGTLGIGQGLASSGGNLIVCNTCITNAMLAATTGAGSVVLGTGPTIVSPTIGGTVVASGAIPNAALVNNTVTVGSTAIALGGTGATIAGLTLTAPTSNNGTFNSPTLVTPALGTPASGILTNATGCPIGSCVSGLGTGVATFLSTPSSANLASAITDETGSGAAVFATSPTIATPTLTSNVTVTGIGSNNGAGGVCITNTNILTIASTNCTTVSDARLKENWSSVRGLDGIMQLRPGAFDWKDRRAGRTLGLRAQDVARVFPEAVEDSGDFVLHSNGKTETIHHTLGVDYVQLIAPLVQSVQELEAEVVELRGEVRRLKATNASLRR